MTRNSLNQMIRTGNPRRLSLTSRSAQYRATFVSCVGLSTHSQKHGVYVCTHVCMGLSMCVPSVSFLSHPPPWFLREGFSLSLELWSVQLGRLDSRSPGCSLLLTAPQPGTPGVGPHTHCFVSGLSVAKDPEGRRGTCPCVLKEMF